VILGHHKIRKKFNYKFNKDLTLGPLNNQVLKINMHQALKMGA